MLSYEAFREQYEKQHPASVPLAPVEVRSEYPRWLRGVVLLMFICAALLSGVHTVPTVYAGIEDDVVAPLVRAVVSLSSFVAVELAIFVAAYARLKANGWLVLAMLVVTFGIALVSNIQSVLKALGANGELGLTLVGVALGIGAPLIALMSGEMFVHMHSASTRADAAAEARYREERKLFDAVVLSAYRKYEKEARSFTVHSLNGANEQPDAPRLLNGSLNGANEQREHGTGNGYSKNMNAKEVVRAWLTAYQTDHPEVWTMSTDAFHALVMSETGAQIGRTSAHNVRAEMKAGK